MNNKIMAAGVVVALCAVALIGVGYAYTATVNSNDNAFASEYITIKAGTGVESIWSFSGSNGIEYDTETTGPGSVTYTSLSTPVVGTKTIDIDASTSNTLANITIKMTIDFSQTTGSPAEAVFTTDQKGLFYTVSDGVIDDSANVSISINNHTYAFTAALSGNDKVTWTSVSIPMSDFEEDRTAEVSISPLAGVTFSSDPGTIDEVKITFVATSVDL